MKAVRYYGKEDIRVEQVPDPELVNPRDAIIKVTATAICGSDLHIYGGYIPTMQPGDILGHEFMGEVVEVGRDNRKLAVGDRVVVPFTIACGRCFFCKEELWSLCDNSNPNAWMAEKLNGYSGSGLFGYSHMYGGYPGGQAEYARVPFADVGPIKVPDGLSDEQVLFLSDILPTGYMAAENCGIRPGDTVAVWGCGPVGQFAIKSAYMLGAERVIAIDRFPERLALAAAQGKAETIDYSQVDVLDELRDPHRRPGPRRLHRRGRPRGARHHARRLVRPGQDLALSGDRPAARAAPGDQRLPEGRHGVDSGRLRRVARQVPAGGGVRQGPDAEDGPDPHAPLPAAAAVADRGRRDRPLVHHHPPRDARRRADHVSHVPREAGPVHQGGHAPGRDAADAVRRRHPGAVLKPPRANVRRASADHCDLAEEFDNGSDRNAPRRFHR